MSPVRPKTNPALTAAADAVANLCEDVFSKLYSGSEMAALAAYSQIKHANLNSKSATFYRSFVPLRRRMVGVLTDTYRRYFKLALAHPSDTGQSADRWAVIQLQPAIHASIEWIRDWYVLACEGENRHLVTLANVQIVSGQTSTSPIDISKLSSPPPASPWRAPAWLFGVSLAFFGIGVVKTNRVPDRESAERLGLSHTRLLFKGAKRVFLWELEKAIEMVRNEETAAAGAIPPSTGGGQTQEQIKPKGSKGLLKGIEGLGPKKTDLSQYTHNLTEKQQLAFSLKFEYELGLAEIASRMGLNHKTVYEHIAAAERKMQQARSNEKRKAHRTKTEDS